MAPSDGDKKPGLARRAWTRWKKIALTIQGFFARVVLFFVFFLVIGPYSLIVRLFGGNFLRHKYPSPGSYWLKRKPDPDTEEDYLRMG